MTFLAPIVLTGLVAAGLPVVIHLLNKSQVTVMKWAAMRFVQECLHKNERKMKLEDLILLILRCLLLALLVLAFALPAIKSGGSLAVAGGPRTAMLVLDRSASMAFNNGQETRLDQAKSAAVKLLDQWPFGTTSGLILAGATPDPVVPTPSNDLPLVKRRIQLVENDAGKTDLYPALKLAVDALKEGNYPRPEVHVFTDDTTSAWARKADIAKLREENPAIEFVHHPAGARETDNTAVTALKMDTATPMVGEPIPLIATVKNWGEVAAQDIRVTASLDREIPQSEELIASMAPGEERNVLLHIKTDVQGFHTVEVKTPADRMPADNVRALAFLARERPKVLIVRENRARGDGPSSAFFLAEALLPVPRSQRERAGMIVVEKTPAEAIPIQPGSYDLIVLCDPTDLSAMGDPEELLAYVQAGGNLLVFPGDHAAGRSTPFPASWKALLPALPGKLETSPEGSPAFHLQDRNFVHPVVEPWNDSAMGSLAAIEFRKRFPLQVAPSSEDGNAPHAILNFSDGKPAIIEWRRGGGYVAVAAFSLQLGWTNFHLHPAFVAIVQRLAGYYFSPQVGELNFAPGTPFSHPAALDTVGREFLVRPPDGDSARPGGRIEGRDDSGFLQYRETKVPGPYEISLQAKEPRLVTFAVQGPGDAGELRYEAPETIESMFQSPEPGNAPAASTALTPAQIRENSRSLWFPLMVVAAVLLLTETALAHRFSQPK